MTISTEETLHLGGDPSQRAEFVTLGAELSKLNHPACPDVDWPRVEQLTIGLFREHGMELQSTAAFVLAHAQLHGLAGISDGMTLLTRFLAQSWDRLWPPAPPTRLEILTWLFTQLQPLFRRQELSGEQVPELRRLDDELRQLNERLDAQIQVPLVPLQVLRKQVHATLQRLTRDIVPAMETAVSTPTPVDAAKPAARKPVGAKRRPVVSSRQSAAPAVVVLKVDATEPAADLASEPKRRALWPWLLALLILLLLTGLFGWWWQSNLQSSTAPPPTASPGIQGQATTEPIHLDSLVLFPPGRAKLKPESMKVLVNSLIDIKAQPGWLIVITGHSDTSGDPKRNLELSRERAEAVKQWMQSMGDIPESCFVVQGKGTEQPIADNDTEGGRRKNRRVDIQLVPSIGACASSTH